MRPVLPLVLATVLIAGCGGGGSSGSGSPFNGVTALAESSPAAHALGFPFTATKNTTRVPGLDPATDAAAVAGAVFPSLDRDSRPSVVALVDSTDIGGALAASVLAAPPLRAAILFSAGSTLPKVSSDALRALGPTGSPTAGNAKVIRVGDVAQPGGLQSTDIIGHDPVSLAAAIDRFQTSTAGEPSSSVMIVSTDAPAYAMPAAAFAAKSGDSILLVDKSGLPAATKGALLQHAKPNIYVLAPPSAVSSKVIRQLRKLGAVKRITGADPAAASVAFDRYKHGKFGWGIAESPGHGFVFASANRPFDAVAAASLSDSGTYGPLLVLPKPRPLNSSIADYLYRNQPGYRGDPTTSVYSHGWLIGDEAAISSSAQAEIDRLLEPVPISSSSSP